MKTNLIIPALAAILGLALAGAPLTTKAQTTPTTSTATAAAAPAVAKVKKEHKKSDFTSYEGTLSAIDATSATVTTKKGDVKLTIDATTKFEVSHKPATAADFAAGDKVTGSYKAADDGSMVAHSIHKKAAK